MRITATLIPTSKSCFSTRSEFTISHLVRRACAWSLENASPQADRQAGKKETKEEVESEGAGGGEVQAKESESGGLGWVGLHQHHTSTDMVPSEGEDGPMIGNQIAAHPSPSSCHRCCHLTLRFRDSLPPRPPGDPPTANHSPLLSALATLSRAYSLGENESLSLSISLSFSATLFSSPALSLSLSLPPSSLPFLSRNLNIPCVELGLTEWNYVTLRWRIGHGKVEIGRVKTPAIVSDGFGRVKALS
ncbi:hypothetical protein ALC60_03107 [Trachymyrmex zeteki]|uniref:Uncharacterized protein n=1 Tax=Mycetomoellerius zeteki TaxID=64791 RepID=A0A151XCH1_9HYME|nr:hypothetical protein ALC60_03107 [Trachymyrmex zeteki]